MGCPYPFRSVWVFDISHFVSFMSLPLYSSLNQCRIFVRSGCFLGQEVFLVMSAVEIYITRGLLVLECEYYITQ